MIRAVRRTVCEFHFSLPRLCKDCSVVDGYRSQDPPHNLQRRFCVCVCVCVCVSGELNDFVFLYSVM